MKEIKTRLIFVDCEAPFGVGSPATGDMTEFGAVDYATRETFHGHDCSRETFEKFRVWIEFIVSDPSRVSPPHATFMSDNPAYDWQWINFYFHKYFGANPFGFSARRIGDFYAGLVGDFSKSNDWKRFRITKHDHNPVNDALGNAEAFKRIIVVAERAERKRVEARVSKQRRVDLSW